MKTLVCLGAILMPVGLGLGLGPEAGLWHIADMHVHDRISLAKEKVCIGLGTGLRSLVDRRD